MKGLGKNFIIAVIILLIIAATFGALQSPFGNTAEITLNELAEKINNEEVESIVAEGNDLTIILQGGEKLQSYKEGDLFDNFKNLGVDPEKLKPDRISIDIRKESGVSFWLAPLLSIILPIALIGFLIWMMFRQAQRGNMQALSFGRTQARMWLPDDKRNKVTFDNVAGLKEAKEELKEIVEFLRNPKKFLDIGARIPRGVILIGPPGSGKTLLARAVSGEANVPFFHMSGSEFVEMFVGVGASRVRDTFRQAKRYAPAILFIDEIDAVGRHRGAGLGGGHDEREQTLNQILVEMDGFETDEKVIVIAATNRPDILDPALLRPGRFDRRVMLDQPDIKDREDILRIHMKDKLCAKDINIREIAERTPGFSGADLSNLVNEAAILAARRDKKELTHEELLESVEKVLLGPERKSHILSEKEKEIAAYHEAGHALVAASLPNADPVHKVSIVARGRAGGYTLKLPSEDRHLRSKKEFLDDLAVMLGGFVTEKIIFGEITTGPCNDLRNASDLARKLVTQYGMSDKLGPVTYGERDEFVFLGREISAEKSYSEEVGASIDREIARFIRNAERTAKKIIQSHAQKLKQIAARLIEKETIERKEFEELMAAPV